MLHVLLSGRLPFLGSGQRLQDVISRGRIAVSFIINLLICYDAVALIVWQIIIELKLILSFHFFLNIYLFLMTA